MPERFDREDLVRKKVREEEEAEHLATKDAHDLTYELLTEQKGYRPEEIEVDRPCPVSVGELHEDVSVDFIVSIEGRPSLAVKCSMAMESRERHVLAFARVALDDMIPYAVVTDGLSAIVLETAAGRRLGEGLHAIPSRERTLLDMERIPRETLPAIRREREARVLLAFECASCPRGPS
jgi:hypothetical protein